MLGRGPSGEVDAERASTGGSSAWLAARRRRGPGDKLAATNPPASVRSTLVPSLLVAVAAVANVNAVARAACTGEASDPLRDSDAGAVALADSDECEAWRATGRRSRSRGVARASNERRDTDGDSALLRLLPPVSRPACACGGCCAPCRSKLRLRLSGLRATPPPPPSVIPASLFDWLCGPRKASPMRLSSDCDGDDGQAAAAATDERDDDDSDDNEGATSSGGGEGRDEASAGCCCSLMSLSFLRAVSAASRSLPAPSAFALPAALLALLRRMGRDCTSTSSGRSNDRRQRRWTRAHGRQAASDAPPACELRSRRDGGRLVAELREPVRIRD